MTVQSNTNGIAIFKPSRGYNKALSLSECNAGTLLEWLRMAQLIVTTRSPLVRQVSSRYSMHKYV